MKTFATAVVLGLATTACSGVPSSPTPPTARPSTQEPTISITVTLTPTGSAGSVRGGQCQAAKPCSFTVTVTPYEGFLRPLHVTIAPGDGTEELAFDVGDGATTKTWSHVYAAGDYFSTLTITQGASMAMVASMRIGIFAR